MAGGSKVNKSPKNTKKKEDENAEADQRKKEVLKEKIKRRVALEEKAFRLVEKLIEEGRLEEDLIGAAPFIDHNHYADVVEERSISALCGYPLCDNKLKAIPKQKYHISTKTNTVYEITDCKKFCNGHCYKASKVFVDQLSTSPVWLRDEQRPQSQVTLHQHSSGESELNGEEVFISAAADLKREVERIERGVDGSGEAREEAGAVGLKSALKAKEKPSLNKQISFSDVPKHDSENDIITQKIESKIRERKKSLQESPTAEVYVQGRESAIQASQTLQKRCSAVSEVSDFSAVRDGIRSGEDGEQEVWRKSISQAAAVTKKISTAEAEEGKSNLICEAVRRKNAGEQLKGVTSLKEILKEEIQSVHRNDSANVTEQLGKRIKERHHSLADPPTPEVFQKGVETINHAKEVGATKAGSMREMHAAISSTEDRLERCRRVGGGNEFEELGKTAMSETKMKKATLLGDILSAKNNVAQKSFSTAAAEKEEAVVEKTDNLPVSLEQHQPPKKPSDSMEALPIRRLNAADVFENVKKLTAHLPDVKLKEEEAKAVVKKEKVKRKKLTALEVLKGSVCEWKTAGTSKWMNFRNTSVDVAENDFEAKYKDLCRRVDKQEFDVTEELEVNSKPIQGSLPEFQELKDDSEEFGLQVREFYAPGKQRQEATAEVEKQFILPCIDSLSQHAVRRKMVFAKLSKVMSELLLPLEISASDVLPDVRQIVHTFKLSNNNISWKPAEWTLVAFILLKLIAVRNNDVQKAFEGAYATPYFRAMTLSSGLMEHDVVSIVDFIKNT